MYRYFFNPKVSNLLVWHVEIPKNIRMDTLIESIHATFAYPILSNLNSETPFHPHSPPCVWVIHVFPHLCFIDNNLPHLFLMCLPLFRVGSITSLRPFSIVHTHFYLSVFEYMRILMFKSSCTCLFCILVNYTPTSTVSENSFEPWQKKGPIYTKRQGFLFQRIKRPRCILISYTCKVKLTHLLRHWLDWQHISGSSQHQRWPRFHRRQPRTHLSIHSNMQLFLSAMGATLTAVAGLCWRVNFTSLSTRRCRCWKKTFLIQCLTIQAYDWA